MSKPDWDIRENTETRKFDVIEIDANGREERVAECDDFEAATDEIEELEQGYFESCEARAAGDDPRYDAPDDPHAEANERYLVMREFMRGEQE